MFGWRRTAALVLVMGATIWCLACSECKNSNDCPLGQVCHNGNCVQNPAPDSYTDSSVDVPDGIDVIDDDVPGDSITDSVVPDADALDPPPDDGSDIPTEGDPEDDGRCESNEECDDGNICTEDTCSMSFHMCMNQPLDGVGCDDGDLCNGIGVCDDVGDCVLNSSPLCEDFNDCTFDTCTDTGEIVCDYDAAAMNGSTCDNDLWCDGTSDVCGDGFCMPADLGFSPCNDGNLCTFDTCTEGATGPVCTHEDLTSFQPVVCGGTASGVTSGPSDLSTYGSCTGILGTGPEVIIKFQHDADTTVTFTLVADPVPTADNNELYLLTDGCDASTCTDSGSPSVSITGVTAGTPVYVVVESVEGGAYYAVQATCS